MKRKFTTNSRLVNELFANYISTFSAFCELINNSIQAKSKKICINIEYTEEHELHPLLIKKIELIDDGVGVHVNDIKEKILDIGTKNKDGGKGIGRFAAFQIGKSIIIETVGFSTQDKTFSKAVIPLSFQNFEKNINVSEIDIETSEEVIKERVSTYYKVIISDLYDSIITEQEPKKKIIDKFLRENVKNAIFERYPLKIFNKEITFEINGEIVNTDDFVVGNPIKKVFTYTNRKGEDHKVLFDFFKIKNMEKIRVFLTTKNSGIQTIANGFEYDARWLSPKIGGWFIYIHSTTLTADLFRNIDLDGLDENFKHYKDFLKSSLNGFFKEKNREFDNFIEKLKRDDYYPYKEKASSQSKVILFDKLAYLVEDKYNILNEQNRLREIIYPLIDRTIANGELDKILGSIIKMTNRMTAKFNELLEMTDLENIIEFSDKVARKIEEVEFLDKLIYSEISKNVKERKELHKYLEKMLWVFGEEYQDSTRLLSDKNLEKNLIQLRDDILKYKPAKSDDNIIEYKEQNIKSITDIFMYSEKILDYKKKEVLVIELKAPKVKISPKELSQVMKYALEIEKGSFFSNLLTFKIILISSDINYAAKYDLEGRQKGQENPYYYFKSESNRTEVWVIKWSDLLENLKRKLTYMSNMLKISDVNVQDKIRTDFENIEFSRESSHLKRVAV